MKKQDENSVILYQDENGVTAVSVRFSNEDLWLTQNQIAEIYDTTQPNISQHIDGILSDGELDAAATHKKFLLVQTEGKRQVKREISHYNLDMVIALGYRVQSQIATRFRRWATAETAQTYNPTKINNLLLPIGAFSAKMRYPANFSRKSIDF